MNILGINKPVTEPSFFALLVKSAQVQFLYLGMHTSVDAAFAVALKQMENTPMYKPGEPVDIDLWNSIPIREVIREITPEEMMETFGKVTKPDSLEELIPELKEFEDWKKETSEPTPPAKKKRKAKGA